MTPDTTHIENPDCPTYDIHPADLVLLIAESASRLGATITCDAAATKRDGMPRFRVSEGGGELHGAAADEVIDYLRDALAEQDAR
jgi:hypothetical protein